MAPPPILAAEDAQLLIDRADSGFVVTDHNAKITYCNSRFAEWTGNAPEALVGLRLSHLLDVPGRVLFDTHIMPMILLQGFAREILCRLAPEGAERFPILLNASHHPADEGPEARIVFNIFDATERGMYEADLRKARDDAEELAAVVRSAQVGIFRIDGTGRVKTCNPCASAMFGFDPAKATGGLITDLVSLQDEADWLDRRTKQARSEDAPEFFHAETPDGRTLSISIIPITEPGTRSLDPDFSLLLRDITQQAQAERQLKITLQELNHRVKNNLAVVMGIARQTFRSEASADETKRFMARLHSMAKAHDLLVSNNWRSTSIHDVAQLMARDSGLEEQFDLQGPDVVFAPQSVAMLALALFELMTNAMKYGALTKSDGRVRLHWTLSGEDKACRFQLTWEEKNGPPLAGPVNSTGFGSKLVKRIVAAELGGTANLDFAPTGLIYSLDAPYSAP